MKVFILLAIAACAFASPDEDIVEIDAANHEGIQEAQFSMNHPMMMNQMMNPMMMGGGMRGMNPMQMGGQGPSIDYSMSCSNSCGCAQMCVPMMPCPCVCPPPCSPDQTTTTGNPDEGQGGNRCENGSPDWTYPTCCWNGGSGDFCCLNGANNIHCCENGANNPWCSLPTQPPVLAPPGGLPPSGDDCNQCQCQPCMPWMPCSPCPCQQRCAGSSGWGK